MKNFRNGFFPMKFRFGKFSVFSALLAVSAGTAVGVHLSLDVCARERERPGMRVSDAALFRKIPGGNALFSSVDFSPDSRRAVLMLAREPRSEAEYARCRDALRRLDESLPPGDRIVLADDSGTALLDRAPSRSRKVFALADELKILFARLGSAPVFYFPSDPARGKVRLDVWEGDAAFPAPESGGVSAAGTPAGKGGSS